mmetsp:Transcript_8877/g.14237  ORF Transcript_8877/g.14237 Transcript_8877/m.14237 type:complete len:347 (-) Transcript_8877:40-1080(-)
MIERYRTRMFEITTQFNAIFRARQTTHVTASAAGDSNNQVSISLLSMWTSRRIHSFLKVLAAELNVMEDSASLRDALDACVFFSGSMGRLGADFTSQLPPLFEQKMLAIVLHSWKEGTTQLADTLKICRDAGVASPLVSTAVAAAENINEGGETTSSSVMMSPPRQLMALPPLGRLVNACLTGLNELRRCLLPGIFSQLRESLEQDFLLEVKSILHAHERAVMTPGLRGEAVQLREVAKEMKEVTKSIVFPYVRGATELSLGNEDGAKEYFDRLRAVLAPPPPLPPAEVEEKEGEEARVVAGEEKVEETTEASEPTPMEEGNAVQPEGAQETEGWADEGIDNIDTV